ncbi:restriction endonuclease subunit S [Kurthia sp. YJT4]|uniref:restriction endonuclease subunit S n=1 Tax=Kurthia sp. YJT4 TaxID=3049086 RepID=UPI00254D5123|nr:restriction endonuclease subunit S [Kurthia sp. YJT4]WIL38503.1 restriction endonuclease subunit S [Kurthia sp. YJT4]
MNVPKLRFKEFDGEWEENKLSNLLVKIEEKATDTTKGVVLTSSRMGLFPRSEYFNGREEKDIEGYSIIPKNTFTYRQMSDDNTFHINYNTKYNLGLVSPEYPVFKTNNFLTDEYFFNYINNSPRFKKHCVLQKKGGTRTRLYFKVLGELVIAKPSIEEQKKIGDFFNLLNKKIQLQQQKIDLLQEQKKGFLQKMFPKAGETQPEMRFDGFTGEWEQSKFAQILKTYPFQSYLMNPSQSGKYEVIQQGDKPVVGYADGEPFEDFDDVSLFGDHTVSLYKPKEPFFVATDGVKIIGADNFDGKYLFATLERYKPDPQGYKRHFTILKNEDIQFTINKDEQVKIGMFFKKLDDIISFHQKKLELLQKQKKGFMQQMFI